VAAQHQHLLSEHGALSRNQIGLGQRTKQAGVNRQASKPAFASTVIAAMSAPRCTARKMSRAAWRGVTVRRRYNLITRRPASHCWAVSASW